MERIEKVRGKIFISVLKGLKCKRYMGTCRDSTVSQPDAGIRGTGATRNDRFRLVTHFEAIVPWRLDSTFCLTTTTSTPSTPRHHRHRRHCSLEVRMPDHDESTPLLVTSTSSTNKMSSSTSATYWRVGALYGAAAVCLGAFGAHGLKSKISDPAKIASWNTAAHYQVNMLHNSLVSSFFN